MKRPPDTIYLQFFGEAGDVGDITTDIDPNDVMRNPDRQWRDNVPYSRVYHPVPMVSEEMSAQFNVIAEESKKRTQERFDRARDIINAIDSHGMKGQWRTREDAETGGGAATADLLIGLLNEQQGEASYRELLRHHLRTGRVEKEALRDWGTERAQKLEALTDAINTLWAVRPGHEGREPMGNTWRELAQSSPNDIHPFCIDAARLVCETAGQQEGCSPVKQLAPVKAQTTRGKYELGRPELIEQAISEARDVAPLAHDVIAALRCFLSVAHNSATYWRDKYEECQFAGADSEPAKKP